MDRSYSYAILQAVPDRRRGERVNIGLVILTESGLDIQVVESRKLRSLTGTSWDSFIEKFAQCLADVDDPNASDPERLAKMQLVQDQLSVERTGWFKAASNNDYESTVKEILRTLVTRPQVSVTREGHAVVAAIAAELKAAAILASSDETISTGKVVRRYHVEPGLEADFAQLNSRLHVASVLDLRSDHPQMAQAALKAIVLDRAASIHGGNVHKIGIYACAPARRAEVREHISILEHYAEDMVNWDDPSDREGLKRMFYDAFNAHNPTPVD